MTVFARTSFPIAALLLTGCTTSDDSSHVYLKIVGASGPASMEVAARVTARYISEKRFLRVSIPEVASPSDEQTKVALSSAVVQPAFRDSNPNGSAYLMCTIHEANREVAQAMLKRCEAQLLEIAQVSGVVLVPEH